jgi:hypothetical protein
MESLITIIDLWYDITEWFYKKILNIQIQYTIWQESTKVLTTSAHPHIVYAQYTMILDNNRLCDCDITNIITKFYDTDLGIYSEKYMNTMCMWLNKFNATILKKRGFDVNSQLIDSIVMIFYRIDEKLYVSKFNPNTEINLISNDPCENADLLSTHQASILIDNI